MVQVTYFLVWSIAISSVISLTNSLQESFYKKVTKIKPSSLLQLGATSNFYSQKTPKSLRRTLIQSSFFLIPTLLEKSSSAAINPAPDFVQSYNDFTKMSEGWQYKDIKEGSGASPRIGDRAVYDWSGYTIGYFGRPFEAKG